MSSQSVITTKIGFETYITRESMDAFLSKTKSKTLKDGKTNTWQSQTYFNYPSSTQHPLQCTFFGTKRPNDAYEAFKQSDRRKNYMVTKATLNYGAKTHDVIYRLKFFLPKTDQSFESSIEFKAKDLRRERVIKLFFDFTTTDADGQPTLSSERR